MSIPKLESDTILAPMAGVTDVAFRLLCRKYGAGMAVTEMISANALSRGNKATLKLIDVVPEEKSRVIQLFGQNTKSLIKAAKICEEQCEMLDLNLGCPASKIIQQGSGSALLERPNKVKEIVTALTKAVNVPITCKIRLGIKKSNINVIKIAQFCEKAGAQLISVHARTQKQGYTGKADWSWIKKVKESVQIPVAGNGDVTTVEDYIRMKQETGCDYVMIGRGAIGNPYLFKQIADYNKTGKYEKTTPEQQINDFFEYLELAEKHNIKFQHIKFHAQAFTKGIKGSSKFRFKLNRINNVEEIKEEMGKLKS